MSQSSSLANRPLCDAFESAWLEGRQEPIERFLPAPSDSTYVATLEELVKLDLEFWWKRVYANEDDFRTLENIARVEHYQEQFECLAEDGFTIRLACYEYAARHRWGDAPSHGDFTSRFPSLAEQLSTTLSEIDGELGQPSDVTAPVEHPAIATDETLDASETVGRDEEALLSVPSFDGLNFVAQGGLGEVFVATDEELKRQVALKFIRREHAEDDESCSRFRVEAEVTARLEHPGIVPVHCIGYTTECRPFYAMRFVQGKSLKDAIKEYHSESVNQRSRIDRNLQFRDLLSRFVSVCNTIAYAHNRGIIHRDIKPDNIMLGRFGETLVVDWGLAMAVGRDAKAKASGEHTLVPSADSGSGESSGGLAGTPSYMSPEQARNTDALTPASDVYSLGVTLFTLIAGRNPYSGKTISDVLRQVGDANYPLPSTVNPRAPKSLEAICVKAMQREPKDRYETARDLAIDIEHWLADEPVSVHKESMAYRLARWTRRHRSWTMASIVTAAVLILSAGTFAVWYKYTAASEHQARLAADQAREEGIQIAAHFASTTVANEIDLRWRILEAEAANADLQALVARINEAGHDEPFDDLSNLLNRVFIKHRDSTKAASWVVVDRNGRIAARCPHEPGVIGKSYRFRDYFHGRGRDLAEAEAEELGPIDHPHLSAVFQSRVFHQLMAGFSVPIPNAASDSDGSPIGVLMMTVKLGEFSVLQSDLGAKQMAVLVDTREDFLEGEPGKGLILQHPRLSALQADLTDSKDSSDFPRLDSSLVAWLEGLRGKRLREKLERSQNGNGMSGARFETLDQDYRDPASGKNGETRLAAFEPVLISGRRRDIMDTGWVVIVQESK